MFSFQLKYLDTCSRSESDRQNNYSDIATLPGVKVPFVARPEPAPRRTMRNSIRKLPRKSSSAKDKKKEAEKEQKRKISDTVKSKQNGKKGSASPEEEQKGSASPPEEEQPTCDTASPTSSGIQADSGSQGGAVKACEKVVVTQLERPIMTSLNASELMLVSSDKGDLGTMVRS